MSAPDAPFCRHLQRAIDLLSVQDLAVWTRFSNALRGLAVEIRTDQEHVHLSCDGDGWPVIVAGLTPPRQPTLRVRISMDGLVALLGGLSTPQQLLHSGAADIMGEADDLARASSAFRTLIEAGLRSRVFHRLYQSFRQSAAAGG